MSFLGISRQQQLDIFKTVRHALLRYHIACQIYYISPPILTNQIKSWQLNFSLHQVTSVMLLSNVSFSDGDDGARVDATSSGAAAAVRAAPPSTPTLLHAYSILQF
jgi:hypothetical protein